MRKNVSCSSRLSTAGLWRQTLKDDKVFNSRSSKYRGQSSPVVVTCYFNMQSVINSALVNDKHFLVTGDHLSFAAITLETNYLAVFPVHLLDIKINQLVAFVGFKKH